MYTTDRLPTDDDRPVVSAFLVWACGEDLEKTLKDLEGKAKRGGGTAVIGLRITAVDGTYYVPGEPFIGGGTTQRGVGSRGYTAGGTNWTVYGTAVRREGEKDPREIEIRIGTGIDARSMELRYVEELVRRRRRT
ncbi:hypothetical protein F7R91_05605 [Streptomyces luteolifulvus]|uniref:Uncharacterized protein n=1 Tax=Streptomyces luteolifulvus TaxID=2615112 RepID=A0A6H9V759_9ACTN|nr:hypothetical protein [Streptomyces luteolifulvus]KAB1149234.1 hypothetical protein F7R91_05605 [Streptomyces luteolifulvus]